jgi:hypothetical protein
MTPAVVLGRVLDLGITPDSLEAEFHACNESIQLWRDLDVTDPDPEQLDQLRNSVVRLIEQWQSQQQLFASLLARLEEMDQPTPSAN